jgi:hypothetical protein
MKLELNYYQWYFTILILQVNDQNYLLKQAAQELNINYSTAKTILRIWRIEKRICKKYGSNKMLKKNKGKIFKVLDSLNNKEKTVIESNNRFTIMSQNKNFRQDNLNSNSNCSSGVLQVSNSHFSVIDQNFEKIDRESKILDLSSSPSTTPCKKITRDQKIINQNLIYENLLRKQISKLFEKLVDERKNICLNYLIILNLKNTLVNLQSNLSSKGFKVEYFQNLIFILEKYVSMGNPCFFT